MNESGPPKALVKIPPRLAGIITENPQLQIGQTILGIHKFADNIEISSAIKGNRILISRRLLCKNYPVSMPRLSINSISNCSPIKP
jgi:hypothetical protein